MGVTAFFNYMFLSNWLVLHLQTIHDQFWFKNSWTQNIKSVGHFQIGAIWFAFCGISEMIVKRVPNITQWPAQTMKIWRRKNCSKQKHITKFRLGRGLQSFVRKTAWKWRHFDQGCEGRASSWSSSEIVISNVCFSSLLLLDPPVKLLFQMYVFHHFSFLILQWNCYFKCMFFNTSPCFHHKLNALLFWSPRI